MTYLVWGGFLFLIVTLLMMDLGIFHRKTHMITIGEALTWTAIWIFISLLFNVFIFFMYSKNLFHWSELHPNLSGQQAALQFFTGYLVEKSLSIDNIFVIAMIFSYFRVPPELQHRVLYWGILGALVLRGAMIAAGATLIANFTWTIYIFGGLLIFSAAKMLTLRDEIIEPEKNPAIKLVQRFLPVTASYHDRRFLIRNKGILYGTPLLLTLVLVETSDVMFAVDSIPAIFAITRDPFIVFTSNIFAILGLRSLYFALAGIMRKFRYLKSSLSFLLAYIGVKMLFSHLYPIPTTISLGVIAGILAVGILASVMSGEKDPNPIKSPIETGAAKIIKMTQRQGRRIIILAIGSTILIIGIIMIVTPGPATILIPLGLGILGIEFAWARRGLKKIKTSVTGLNQALGKKKTDAGYDPETQAANTEGDQPRKD